MKAEKKVHAYNEVRRIATKQLAHILPQLKNKIGEKCLNADGSRPKKFNIEYLDIKPKKFNEEYANIHWCRLDISYSSIWFKLSICFKDTDHTCFYEDISIYVGDFSNLIIDRIIDEAPIYKKTTAKKQLKLREDIYKLKGKLRNLESKYILK